MLVMEVYCSLSVPSRAKPDAVKRGAVPTPKEPRETLLGARGGISAYPEFSPMPSARPFWKGYLKLSLVSCPIALYPASSSSERASFRQINKKTGHRLKQQLFERPDIICAR